MATMMKTVAAGDHDGEDDDDDDDDDDPDDRDYRVDEGDDEDGDKIVFCCMSIHSEYASLMHVLVARRFHASRNRGYRFGRTCLMNMFDRLIRPSSVVFPLGLDAVAKLSSGPQDFHMSSLKCNSVIVRSMAKPVCLLLLDPLCPCPSLGSPTRCRPRCYCTNLYLPARMGLASLVHLLAPPYVFPCWVSRRCCPRRRARLLDGEHVLRSHRARQPISPWADTAGPTSYRSIPPTSLGRSRKHRRLDNSPFWRRRVLAAKG